MDGGTHLAAVGVMALFSILKDTMSLHSFRGWSIVLRNDYRPAIIIIPACEIAMLGQV